MADFTISVNLDARQTKAGGEEVKRNMKGIAADAEATGRKLKSVAQTDYSGLKEQLQGLTGRFSSLTSGVGAAGGPLAAVAAAVLAVGAAAAVAAKQIFDFVKDYAASVKEISNGIEVTGLSAEALSAFKYQVEATGKSFPDLLQGLTSFSKKIGDAQNGSKEAAAALARLGIDAGKVGNDMDGALRQALDAITKMPPGIQRTNGMMAAFGEEGAKLIPFINSLKGGFDGLIKKAHELGVVLSAEDVQAAKEFNASLAEVQAMLRGVAMSFAKELLPVVQDVLTDVATWLKNNKGKVAEWANFVAKAVDVAITSFKVLAAVIAAASNGPGGLASLAWTIPQIMAGGEVPDYTPHPEWFQNQNGGSAAAAPKVPKIPRRVTKIAATILPEAKQAKELEKMLSDLQIEMDFFGQKTEEAAMRQDLLKRGIFGLNTGLADQLIALAEDNDIKIANAEATKKAADAAERYNDLFGSTQQSIVMGGIGDRADAVAQIAAINQQIALGRELTDVERQMIENQSILTRARAEYQAAGLKPDDIKLLADQLTTEQKVTFEKLKQLSIDKEKLALITATKALETGLSSELAELTNLYRTGAEATTVFRIEQELLKDTYKGLSAEKKQQILATAAEIDAMKAAIKAQEEYRRQYDQVFGTIRDSLDVLANEGFGGFFKSVASKFQSFLRDMLAEWLTSKFFKVFSGGGGLGQGSNGSGGGGIFDKILNGIFGKGNGQGPGGTPTFNGNNFAGGGGGNGGPLSNSDVMKWLSSGVNGGGNDNASSGGGLGDLRKLFSSSEGGLFGPRKNLLTGKDSKLAGVLGGAGSLAAVVGSMIGGRAGSYLSNIGTGMSIGAMFGPVGAVVGAAIGFFATLFGGDPKKKRDKNEKLPQMNRGFTDALSELRNLVGDVRTLRVSPDSAIARATELRNSIASGFGVQFESKKYQKQAQVLIASRTREADTLIEELRRVAEVSRAAGERERRILPEFAGGGFMSRDFMSQYGQFKRRNGLLGGQWTGIDYLPSLLADEEMVVNPKQRQQVIRNAGMDPFRNAGIPGYSGGVSFAQPAPQAVSVNAGDLTVQISLQQDAAGMWAATAKSPTGKKVITEIVQSNFRNGEIDTRRRGI